MRPVRDDQIGVAIVVEIDHREAAVSGDGDPSGDVGVAHVEVDPRAVGEGEVGFPIAIEVARRDLLQLAVAATEIRQGWAGSRRGEDADEARAVTRLHDEIAEPVTEEVADANRKAIGSSAGRVDRGREAVGAAALDVGDVLARLTQDADGSDRAQVGEAVTVDVDLRLAQPRCQGAVRMGGQMRLAEMPSGPPR